jgi:Zn-dependent oligopeptidase
LAEHARIPALKEILNSKPLPQQDGIEELQPWDSSYYSEKLKATIQPFSRRFKTVFPCTQSYSRFI